jgi:hypothetical protein
LHKVPPNQIEEENATSQKAQAEDRSEKPPNDSTSLRAGDLDGQHQAKVETSLAARKEKVKQAAARSCVAIQGKSPLVQTATIGMVKAWQVGQQPGGASVPPF